MKIIPLNGNINLEFLKIDLVSLTHSILEPNALLIEYKGKKIFHTGDWKCDLNPMMGNNINEKKLKEIGDKDRGGQRDTGKTHRRKRSPAGDKRLVQRDIRCQRQNQRNHLWHRPLVRDQELPQHKGQEHEGNADAGK